MHLWEFHHPYYCTESNYFRRGDSDVAVTWDFDSFADFMEEMGDADKDYNFLIRWDWCVDCASNDEELDDDPSSRSEVLKLVYMHQRKGYHSTSFVKVARNDEPEVREFLKSHWEHTRKMWEPISNG